MVATFSNVISKNLKVINKSKTEFLNDLHRFHVEFSGVDNVTLSRWLNNKTKPSLYRKLLMYLILNLEIDDLLTAELNGIKHREKRREDKIMTNLFSRKTSKSYLYKDIRKNYSLNLVHPNKWFYYQLERYKSNTLNVMSIITPNKSYSVKEFIIVGHFDHQNIDSHFNFYFFSKKSDTNKNKISLQVGSILVTPHSSLCKDKIIVMAPSNANDAVDYMTLAKEFFNFIRRTSKNMWACTVLLIVLDIDFKNFLISIGCVQLDDFFKSKDDKIYFILQMEPIKIMSNHFILSSIYSQFE